MDRSKFQKGSGCFTCVSCARKTRENGEGTDTCCGLCYEVAGWENVIQDTDDPDRISQAKREIARLNAEVIGKGGKLDEVSTADAQAYITTLQKPSKESKTMTASKKSTKTSTAKKSTTVADVIAKMTEMELPVIDINRRAISAALKDGMSVTKIINSFKKEFDDEAPVKKATVKKAAKKVVKAAPVEKSDRNIVPVDGKITKIVKDNPRREGSHGYNSYELYKTGLSVSKFVEAGGRMVDLRWDIAKGNVSVA